jgi:anti-sigma factor RsiW
MKKCEHYKNLIITDYIDGQANKKDGPEVEDHLLDCADCRAFFREIKSQVGSFQETCLEPVPAQLWDSIKDAIEVEKQSDPLKDFIEGLKGWLMLPRVVPVFGSLVLMLLAGSVTLNTVQLQQAQDKAQGEYLVSLLAPVGSSSDSNDLGTPIEHYFL